MGTHPLPAIFILLLTLTSFHPSLSCPTCPYRTPPPPKKPPPPSILCPPPPSPSPPPPSPPPPKAYPPPLPPSPKPCPPPPQAACPIDTLKLSACVDLLSGLVHVGIGSDAKATCCPVLSGIADFDAALCLCTTIKAKLLNINLLLPIALELLVDCGKHAPKDFQCPA